MERLIESIDYGTQLAKVTMEGVINKPGAAAEIFRTLGQYGLNVELISSSQSKRNRVDISFAIMKSDKKTVTKVLNVMQAKYDTRNIVVDQECALVSIYGPMLAHTPGVAGKIFGILAERHINIEMINTSLSGMNLVVQKDQVMDAVAALRTEFGI